MELEQAFEVVARVEIEVLSSLGEKSHKHLSLDRWFMRAENYLKCGQSVEDVVSLLSREVCSEVERKVREDEGQGRECEVAFVEQTAAGKPSHGWIKEESIKLESIVENDSSHSNSAGGSRATLSQSDAITIDSDGDDKSTILVDLTDDSSDLRSSSSCSDVVFVAEENNQVDKISGSTSLIDIDLDDSEPIGLVKKSIEELKAQDCLYANADNQNTSYDPQLVGGSSASCSEKPSTSWGFSFETVHSKEMYNPEVDENSNLWKNSDVDQPSTHTELLNSDAKTLKSLLPHLEVHDIMHSLEDHIFHPDRFTSVLEQYIDLSIDRGEYVPEEAYVKLIKLKTKRKRQNSESELMQSFQEAVDNQPKLPKFCNDDVKVEPSGTPTGPGDEEQAPTVSNAQQNQENTPPGNTARTLDFGAILDYSNVRASVSQNGEPVPGQMNQDNISALHDNLQDNANEREKWCQDKVAFILDIFKDLSYHEVYTKVSNCVSDVDVEMLVVQLLEQKNDSVEAMDTQETRLDVPVGGSELDTSNNNWTQDHTSKMDQGASTSSTYQDHNVAQDTGPSTSGLGSTSASVRDNGDSVGGVGGGEEAEEGGTCGQQAGDIEDRIMGHYLQLTEMFSDADPDYLHERCQEMQGNQQQLEELVLYMTEKKGYPKREDYLKRKKKLELRKKFIEGMSVEEFLEYFENPEKVFYLTEKTMSPQYVKNARDQLHIDLPYALSKDIDNALRKNNYHYLPTLKALMKDTKLGRRKTKRRQVAPPPADLDDIFIKELCFAKIEERTKSHRRQKDKEEEEAFIKAKSDGKLEECGCCFDDEVLKSKMSPCDSEDSHYFCNNCVKRYAEEQIGQGKLEFRCLQGECKAEFSLPVLRKVLKPSVFSNLLKRKQMEEIAAAGIEDLVSCPFCNFATIMPNKEDKVFKCLNPECMKDSCRLCKEPNHIPLRCEEFEKKQETDARTHLENQMTEAMVRECWKCKKRFIKEDGCNKMVCSCGAMMCYLCRNPINGYNHFKENGGVCPLWSNSIKLHAEEVRKVASEARKNVDPNITLKLDPTKDLPEIPDYLKNVPTHMQNQQPVAQVALDAARNQLRDVLRQVHYQLNVFPNEERRHVPQPVPPIMFIPEPAAPLPPPPAHLPPPPPAHQHQHYHHHYHHHQHYARPNALVPMVVRQVPYVANQPQPPADHPLARHQRQHQMINDFIAHHQQQQQQQQQQQIHAQGFHAEHLPNFTHQH